MKISLNNHPGYKAAHGKLEQLQRDRNEADTRLREKLSQRRQARMSDAQTKRRVQAEAMLRGESVATVNEIEIDDSISRSKEHIRILDAAIHIQQGELMKQRAKASAAICAELRPEYEKIVSDLVAAVKKLESVQLAEEEFRDTMIRADLQFTSLLPVAAIPNGLIQHDKQGNLQRWMLDIQQHYKVKGRGGE